jgi:hypothetical protein
MPVVVWVVGEKFDTKWDEAREGLRKVHHEELDGLYCSPNIIRMMK